MKTFLFAGHDTTASTISWVVYALSLNPQCEAKVVEELQAVLQGRKPGNDDLVQLKYLTMVVKEALRWG